jgi:hypothetical protein
MCSPSKWFPNIELSPCPIRQVAICGIISVSPGNKIAFTTKLEVSVERILPSSELLQLLKKSMKKGIAIPILLICLYFTK